MEAREAQGRKAPSRTTSRVRGALVLVGLCLPFLATGLVIGPSGYAQSCDRVITTRQTVTVYRDPPTFVTGRGFVYGSPVATLPQGLRIQICRSISIGFGFSREKWYQVAYFDKKKNWQYGWAEAKRLDQQAVTLRRAPGTSPGLFHTIRHSLSTSTAFAQPVSPPANQGPPPPPDNGPPTVDTGPAFELLGWTYGFVLFGMVSQAFFASMDSRTSMLKVMSQNLRRIVAGALVSPVIMLAFVQSAELTPRDLRGYIVLLLLAFEHGFAWQTVLAKRQARWKDGG